MLLAVTAVMPKPPPIYAGPTIPVEADRGPLPVDAQIAGILGVERAFAVAQPGDKGAGAFLAENVAVRQAPLADRALDHRGEAARDVAEKLVPGADQFVGPVVVRGRLA